MGSGGGRSGAGDGGPGRVADAPRPRRQQRGRAPLVAFCVLLAAAAVAVAAPGVGRLMEVAGSPDGWLSAVALGVLGVVSARLRAHETESDVDLSFTAVVLLCAAVFLGPAGAALLGAAVSSGSGDRLVRSVNAAMTALVGACAAWAYLAAGGVGLAGQLRRGDDDLVVGSGMWPLVESVAVPLVVADVTLIVANVAVLAVLFRLSGGNARTVVTGPFTRNVVIYLAYSLIAFTFVMLWGPAGVGPLAAVLVTAPLLVARWAYRQDVAERRARSRILEAIAAAAESRDGSARRRLRLRALARAMAAELGLSPRARANLLRAVDLHDVGTVAVPRAILDGGLDELEDSAQARDHLRRHPVAAYEILSPLDFLGDVPRTVRHHHERVDGRGYPDGLAGEQIPLAARILAVADVYEAEAWPDDESAPGLHARAARAVRDAGGAQLDARLVDVLAGALARRGDGPAVAAWLDALGDGDERGDPATVRPRLRHARATVSDLLALDERPPDAGPTGAERAHTRPAGRRSGPPNASRAPRPARPAGSRRRRLLDGGALLGAGAVVGALVWWAGAGQPPGAREFLLAAALTMLVGERLPVSSGRLPTAYAAWAVGLGLALAPGAVGIGAAGPGADVASSGPVPLWQVLVAAGLASGAGLVLAAARPGATASTADREDLVDALVRGASVAGAAALVRVAGADGRPLVEEFARHPGWWTTLAATGVVVLALTFSWLVRGAVAASTRRTALHEELGRLWGAALPIALATGATGVMLAVAAPVVGALAAPLVAAPLCVVSMAVRRQAQVADAHEESLRALSRLPEIAGAVHPGHAEAVAATAQRLGRSFGLGARALAQVREAALLHDVGQVGLHRPIPGGATVLAAPADQERIAALSGDVARLAGVDETVVDVITQQSVPYHEVVREQRSLGLAARLLKVANAFDDHRRSDEGVEVGALDPGDAARAALERLYLGYGHEFDPRVVDALDRLLTSGSLDGPGVAAGERRSGPAPGPDGDRGDGTTRSRRGRLRARPRGVGAVSGAQRARGTSA
ncbi:HD domain-containing phosphohydrolase [Agilicoccus flavus]|uniref:HD domain-containing phosphohydrolase n=1 Tax=Agilicoccus flavus TaxID=2775968 RepID=UPI001CF6AF22|nr:HD domain-containing phosphohydrolase [Agilicoccus flavus]